MPRSLDYRASSTHPAERVYSTMVDRDVLEKRLAEMGGPGAAVLEYEPAGDGVSFTIQHGIAAEDLPEMVTKLLPGGRVVIKRTERWALADDGGYAGTGRVSIAGTPATAKAAMRLADTADGSELAVDVQVTVKVPIVGSRVEEAVAEQIRNLLTAETEFTMSQLS